MKNISGICGNAVTREVKRAILSNANAKAERTGAIINSTFGAVVTSTLCGFSTFEYMNNNSGKSLCLLLSAAVGSAVTSLNLKKLVNACKVKHQNTKELKKAVYNKNYPDVVNRFLRIKGEKELTPKEIFKACNKITANC